MTKAPMMTWSNSQPRENRRRTRPYRPAGPLGNGLTGPVHVNECWVVCDIPIFVGCHCGFTCIGLNTLKNSSVWWAIACHLLSTPDLD